MIKKLSLYLELARPDNWTKNFLILPGFFLSLAFGPTTSPHLIRQFIIGFLAICLICSANYIINEWLDREFDKYHPIKKNRHSVVHALEHKFIYLEYTVCLVAGALLSLMISLPFLITNLILLLMGILYNVKPFRTKDVVYLDVLSESINNPIRLLLGWLIVSNTLPPATLLLSYWMGGAYVMAVKRYSELCFFQELATATQYRKSFQSYSSEKLLVSCLFYSLCSAFFWSIFVVKYQLNLIYLSPLYALLFAWYLLIGFKPNSIAQHPEYIYKEKSFTIVTMIVAVITFLLLFIN